MLTARPSPLSRLLEGLNPEQAGAVSFGDGPLLVLAGAGSGKTRVLTRRLAWLVGQGLPEEGIVALTFTNKAAGEMKERVAALLGRDRPRSFVGTFHAYGVRFLRRFAEPAGLPRGFTVFDADDQAALVKRAMKEAAVPDRAFTPRSLLARISQAKNGGFGPDDYPKRFGDYVGRQLAAVHRAYQKGLAAASALDFDDLLVLTVRLLERDGDVLAGIHRSVLHVLVDEYQDTNGVQARLVTLLAGERQNIFAVGDEDQSIYRWRGADVSNILEFEKVFPGAGTVRLERNYRSTAPILAAAGAVVARNERRLGKTLLSERGSGARVRLLIVAEERDEAREVVSRVVSARRDHPGGEVAVLFRTNAQSRPFEDELVRAGQPYLLVGGTRFYERAEVKDAIAYLRLSLNQDDDVSFRRIVNVPARGVGAATLETIARAASRRGFSLFATLAVPPEGLTERARRALGEFRALVEGLRAEAAPGAPAGVAVAAVLERAGLASLYESSEDPQDSARRENLDQLQSAAREHDRRVQGAPEDEGEAGLAGFLDAVSLRSDADDVDERKGVLLMTLHSAKGLEFEEVFLTGVEDGSLPHASSKDDPEQLEEERRLAYVGMTRARSRLTLSLARRRMVHGEWRDREPSPFLDAIPPGVLDCEDLSGFSRGLGSRAGDGSLFPDYEAESQEHVVAPVRRGTPRPLPPRAAMRRTPPPPTASGFRRGSKVRHPEYGPGVVLQIEGSGDAERLTVYFDRAGRKKFVAKFANLSAG